MSTPEKRGGGGLSIAGRFSLLMTLALAVVMGAGGYFLLQKSRVALRQATLSFVDETARLTAEEEEQRRANLHEQLENKIGELGGKIERLAAELEADRDSEKVKKTMEEVARYPTSWLKAFEKDEWHVPAFRTYTDMGTGVDAGSSVRRQNVLFTAESTRAGERGLLVQWNKRGNLLAPDDPYGGQGDRLRGLILLVSALIVAVGAGVALYVSLQVTKPLEQLGNDVRQISHGNLKHRTRVKGGGEVYHLARQIDRMAQTLEEAQENEIELSVREREREVAQEVREALLPQAPPSVAGYQVADLHVDAAEPGGDFHDFVAADGRLSIVVCEVSGRGVPGALVGATARAYLRSRLERGGELGDVLRDANRQIARDVRRGMFVTALCAQLDPAADVAHVACAGHKLPLVRYEAESQQVKLIQPEGIALGFDKGPVFDRSLNVVRVPLAPGDRLVLSTTGPAQVVDAEGAELGEKGFYRLVARVAGLPPEKAVQGLLRALEGHAGEEEFPADISLVVLARSV